MSVFIKHFAYKDPVITVKSFTVPIAVIPNFNLKEKKVALLHHVYLKSKSVILVILKGSFRISIYSFRIFA